MWDLASELTIIYEDCIRLLVLHRFKCECLKVAVLKNKWLAQHLGGKTEDNLNLLIAVEYLAFQETCFLLFSSMKCQRLWIQG